MSEKGWKELGVGEAAEGDVLIRARGSAGGKEEGSPAVRGEPRRIGKSIARLAPKLSSLFFLFAAGYRFVCQKRTASTWEAFELLAVSALQ